MAGGWMSIASSDGGYRGAGTMDTGGDVEEFAQDVFGVVWWLAAQLAKLEVHDETDPRFRAAALGWIEVANEQQHTQAGFALGGRAGPEDF